jgi:hypothetical protein
LKGQAVFFLLAAALAVAFVFYLLIPAVAAASTAATWRHFRQRVRALSSAPALRYATVAAARKGGPGAVYGPYTLRGRIDAMQGDDRLWIRSEEVSAVVDFSSTPLHVLAPLEGEPPLDAIERAGRLERLPWRRVRFFSEGTRLFAAGMLRIEDGEAVFVDVPGMPLVAVSYDGGEADLVERIVAGGRSRNELWNGVTTVSWAIGLGFMTLLFIYFSRLSTLPTVRFLSYLTAFAPLLPFAPPGAALMVAATALWRRCLRIRMDRDLTEPGRPAEPAGAEKGGFGTAYGQVRNKAWIEATRKAVLTGGLAALSGAAALLLNSVLAFLVFRLVS